MIRVQELIKSRDVYSSTPTRRRGQCSKANKHLLCLLIIVESVLANHHILIQSIHPKSEVYGRRPVLEPCALHQIIFRVVLSVSGRGLRHDLYYLRDAILL